MRKGNDISTSRQRKLSRIIETIEISASRDRVWEVISDVDNEPEYWWGTREVRNFSKEDNVINREIFQNFGNRSILQKVVLTQQSEVEIQYLKGITEGVKHLRLDSLKGGNQELVAEWNIRFTGIYWLISPFIAKHVRKGTKDALVRIKEASEGRPIVQREKIAKGQR